MAQPLPMVGLTDEYRMYLGHTYIRKLGAAWVAQSAELPTGSGHDLVVPEFQPHLGLCAHSSEPGACFTFCVSFSLCPSPLHALSLFVSKINKPLKKKLKKKKKQKHIKQGHVLIDQLTKKL